MPVCPVCQKPLARGVLLVHDTRRNLVMHAHCVLPQTPPMPTLRRQPTIGKIIQPTIDDNAVTPFVY